ncbi:hypothetical protein J3R82DRAFT_3213 [Butyriboletus roseoflavus]|nr:hypothetical protein J3R82DRAFT_3213 [Butyriboletus roseoflavus]
MVFYGILDLMSGPVFLMGFMLLVAQYDTQTLAVTGLANPDRGMYEEAPQKMAPHQAPPEGVPPPATVPNA